MICGARHRQQIIYVNVSEYPISNVMLEARLAALTVGDNFDPELDLPLLSDHVLRQREVSMLRYRLVAHAVPATWRSRAAARLRADFPSGKAQPTRVRRLISRSSRSSGLSGKGVISDHLFDRRFGKLGGFGQPQRSQLLDYSDSLFARCHKVLAGVDRLENGCDS
jgi:hypothetical protein